jgi:hypothetical protein
MTFLGKYDTPLTLYVNREIRRAQWEAERDTWAADATTIEEGKPPQEPTPAQFAEWERQHPFPEDVDGDKDYWVKYRRVLTVRQRNWLREQFAEQVEVAPGRHRIIIVKPFDNAREAALMAIVEWNLDGPGGLLPFSPHDPEKELATRPPTPSPLRVSWEMLPPHIADLIQEVIVSTDAEPAPAEDRTFPPGGGGSATVREVAAPDDHEGVA